MLAEGIAVDDSLDDLLRVRDEGESLDGRHFLLDDVEHLLMLRIQVGRVEDERERVSNQGGYI